METLRSAALVERLRAVHLEMVGAVLGGQGLEKVAALASEATGGRVAIVVPRLAVAAGAPPALRSYVAERVRGRPAPVPEGVVLEIPIASGESVLGSVLLLGKGVAEAGEFLQLAAVASLTELAIADARDEVEHTLRGSFLEDLRTRNEQDAADVVRRAARMGCDLTKGAVALCAEIDAGRPRHVATAIAAEHPGALADYVEEENRVLALLPGTAGPEATTGAARKLAERLSDHATTGVSSFHSDPADAGRALQEAELVLEVVRRAGPTGVSDELGSATYRLLLRVLANNPEEVRAFYEDTIGPLVSYDEQYRTDLVGTLQRWFENDCSASATAAAIFAHRHTVAYRLERVRELTGLNPSSAEDRERLGLGLKALRIMGPKSRR